jgi:predicted NBD/HSP70 family sugar kinase
MNAAFFALNGPKGANRRLVFDQIRRSDVISRTDIVGTTGLSKAAVSTIVAELLAEGLVEEVGSDDANAAGRPRILLRLKETACLALGAELTDEECRVVLTDLRAQALCCVVRPVENLTPAGVLAVLSEAVAEATADVDPGRILGMGSCVPGVVHAPSGVVVSSVLLGWHSIPLHDRLASRFPWPCAVYTRGNAGAWGEHWYGSGRNIRNFMYARVGSGIGAGLIINGAPYLGQDFAAGELGHVAVQHDGALCLCGNRGCLHTVASTTALVDRSRQLMLQARHQADPIWQVAPMDLRRMAFAHVIEALNLGSRVAAEACAEVAYWLAVALGSIINLLNLDMVVIGGPIAGAQEHLLIPLREQLVRRTEATHRARVQVVLSALNEDAPAIGAASLVLHELLAPPQVYGIPYSGW